MPTPSLDLLLNLGLDELKIPSGEITNLPFLRKLAEANRSLILSYIRAEVDLIKEIPNFSYRKYDLISSPAFPGDAVKA